MPTIKIMESMKVPKDHDRQTELTRARYDRIAPMYDRMEGITERVAFSRWRQELWSHLPPGRILEVGVGTGKNIPYYPPGSQVIAIDLSEGMLNHARRRAQALGLSVDLRYMDAQHLEFPAGFFDAAVATFVFCSVPDPILGLRELGRVVRPNGDIWLLEHMRVDKPVVGALMDILNLGVVRLMGANINRRTVENVRQAGLRVISVKNMKGELVRLIHAQP